MEGGRATFLCARFCCYVAVVAIFILLGCRDFYCTCKPQNFDCNLYLVLPVFIVFVFVLWTDGAFQRVCRHLCSASGGSAPLPTCSFLGFCFHHVIKAAFIGLLWVVCVLVDGDWYVCCMNDRSEQQAQLACKDLTTDEDRVIIAELKNESRMIGTFLLFGIVGVPALLSLFGWRKPSSCERRHLFYELILKEEKNVLKEILRKYAKEKLTEEIENRIRGGRWEECFDVAEELIKASAEPTCSD